MPDARTYGNTMMSRLIVNSVELCKDLIQHGCIPNKTHFLQFPYNSLTEDLYPHFIRGLFDGDGCVTGTSKNPLFRLTGYKYFLLEVQAVLMNKCDLNKTALKRYPNKSPDVADLNYGGKNNCEKIFHYFYDNATIYLPRKRDKFLALISQ